MGNTEQLYTVRLLEPVHLGACIARQEGLPTLFVRGGAPGELVEVRITKKQRKIAWAEVVKVIEPSPHRIYSEEIPGADLAYLEAPYVRQWKRQVLLQQLRRVGSAELSESIQELYGLQGVEIAAPPEDRDKKIIEHWRTRAQFDVLETGQLAMRGYRSHDLLPLDDWSPLEDLFEKAGVFDSTDWRRRLQGTKRALLTNPTSGARVFAGESVWDLEGNPQKEQSARWEVSIEDETKQFAVELEGFWQVHRQAPEVLVETVLEFAELEGFEKVIELYSGSGLFSYFLGKKLPDGRLITMEQSEVAVQAARANCLDLPVEAVTGDVTPESVEHLFEKMENKVDLVVLDPPRAGMGIKLADTLAKLNPEKIILVSCDPAACARDLNTLMMQGYRVSKMGAWDIFPHTHHFEVVTCLTK